MSRAEMREYLLKNRDKFPEYSDMEIKYVLSQWKDGETDER